MTLNHSSYNIKLFKEEYKKYIWAIALSFVFYIFPKIILPLLIFSSITNDLDPNLLKSKLADINAFLTIDNSINKVVTIILAFIVGISIFSYLHNRKKVDFYHSLPISRNNLFFVKYILGIFIVIPVMVIVQFLAYGILSFALKDNIIEFKYILESIIFDIVFFINIYSFVVFSNIIAGNTVIGILLPEIIINLGLIITVIIIGLGELFFNNVYLDSLLDYQLKYNPLLSYLITQNKYPLEIDITKTQLLIIHIIISLIVTALCWLLFKIRKSEKSNVCISFKYAKTILKYLGVCIGSLIIGLIFFSINDMISSFYFGIILGSVILHCIVEIIYDFDFKSIFKNWYSIIGCAIISCFILSIFQFDIFKVQQYIPNIDNVKNIDIEPIYNTTGDINNIEDTEIIDLITELHKISVENNKINNEDYVDGFKVDYNLKNGLVVSRRIQIYNESLDTLTKLINNKQYIESSLPFLYDNDLLKKVLNVQLFDNANNNTYITNNNQILDLLSNLKKDIEQNGVDIYSHNVKFRLSLEISLNNGLRNYYSLPILDKYSNTLDYLSTTLNLTPKNLDSNDIDYIKIYDWETGIDKKINDKEIINSLLSDYLNESLVENTNYYFNYNICLVDKNEDYIYIWVNDNLVKSLGLLD